jgi:hypothetical protein
VADSGNGAPAESRLARLRTAYGTILEGYRELERLSRREVRTLRERGEIAKVNAILREKKSVLRGIRAEEERVTGEREWWKKSRRSLPPASCRDLLSLLDAISRTIESAVALEAECRALLQDAVRPAGAAPRLAASPRAAALAYARGGDAGREA